MSGISYDLSKIKAFAFDVDGVLSPSCIPLSKDGEPLRMVNIKDGFAIQLAVKRGYCFSIITGAATNAVRIRFEGLGVKDIYQGAAHKLPVLEEWMEKRNLLPEEVAFMGDDIPDIMAMRHVGLPCAPADAAWEVKKTALYISRFNGGHGCARDLIEQVLKTQGCWMNDAESFGW